MWPYYPDLLARPVPRYTSYPTAAEFHAGEWDDAYIAAIEATTGPLSLYLHIPYCQSICWYCGCNTGAANKQARLASYLEALHREIALLSLLLPRSATIERIALGGGSPNAISPIEFVRLLDTVVTAFSVANPVMSVEIDPRGFSSDWIAVLRATGITHASMGVQTFDATIQHAIGRVQPAAMIEETTEGLRRAGVKSVNFDLMYGLPGQTPDRLSATLDATLGLAPERIALFGYAHVPHLLPRQQRIDDSALPDQAERFAMADLGHQHLTATGYDSIGFDHFALPDDPMAAAARDGTLRRNFQGFTDDQAPVLIGLGASAISIFPDLIVQNEKNAGRYRMRLSQDRLTAVHGVTRTSEDRRRGRLIEDVLCGRPASLAEVGGASAWRGALLPFTDRGLARIEGDMLFPTPATIPYARTIAALFDQYRDPGQRSFSSAV